MKGLFFYRIHLVKLKIIFYKVGSPPDMPIVFFDPITQLLFDIKEKPLTFNIFRWLTTHYTKLVTFFCKKLYYDYYFF